jgi:hypothetical protein
MSLVSGIRTPLKYTNEMVEKGRFLDFCIAALRELAVPMILFCITVSGLWFHGAFRAEFADYPDEAAHYITGLLVHDYIASFNYFSPLKFAENFYVHYPKVAIGHWPPVFYFVQAAWTLIFSVTHLSLMFLMATITTLLAFVIYKILLPEFGRWIAFGAATIFVVLPLVQEQSGRLMADTLVTLFMLIATFYFGRFVDTERPSNAIAFGVWSALALLTKGSALALIFVPPLAILGARKWRLILRPALWYAAAIVVLSCTPWYWLTRHMSNGNSWQQSLVTKAYFTSALDFFWTNIVHVVGWGFAILVVVGFFGKAIQLWRNPNGRGMWWALGGLFFGCMIVMCSIPTGLEERFLLPALTIVVAYLAAGLACLVSRLPSGKVQLTFLTGVILLCFASSGFSFRQTHNRGYSAAARTILSNPQFNDSVVLVSSDADGEGGFISEVAMHERRPGHIVLRASKVIARGNWNGQHVKLLFHSPMEVLAYLDSVPVGAVVLDNSRPNSRSASPYENLLEEAMAAPPHHWKLLQSYPVWKEGVEDIGALQIYIRTVPAINPRGLIRVDLTDMLGKVLKFEVPKSRPE